MATASGLAVCWIGPWPRLRYAVRSMTKCTGASGGAKSVSCATVLRNSPNTEEVALKPAVFRLAMLFATTSIWRSSVTCRDIVTRRVLSTAQFPLSDGDPRSQATAAASFRGGFFQTAARLQPGPLPRGLLSEFQQGK